MDDAVLMHRLHFGFTITYHYLFPQVTMGLALLIVVLKSLALARNDARYDQAARFWAKIFAVNFVFGVITGIPMEFQFGTNWATVFDHGRGRDRPDAGDGGDVRLLPRILVSRALPLRRKEVGTSRSLPGGAHGLHRLVAVGLFHHRDECVDAASGWPFGGAGWGGSPRRFLGPAL